MERAVGAASSAFIMGGASRRRSNSKTRPRPPSRSSSNANPPPMPYLSYTPTLGRNSQFLDLTEEQREELGGIEYRSLKLLVKITSGRFSRIGSHLAMVKGATCANVCARKRGLFFLPSVRTGLSPWMDIQHEPCSSGLS